jgi:N6-adenosine-specific RNA methylase IME4
VTEEIAVVEVAEPAVLVKPHTLLADPPWWEHGGGKSKRGADRHYPLMKTKDIVDLEVRGLPVSQVVADDAHIYLWVTNNFLPDGLKVMEAWGFRYVTCITWTKDKIGLGQYFRGKSEQLLFGVRGKTLYQTLPDGKRAQGVTSVEAPRGRHSAKPEVFREMIERVSPGPYLELFARVRAPGWDAWGNEV